MSIENLTLAHFRHFSSLFTNLPAYKAADIYVPIRHYICRESSTNQLLFMQNKPNFPKSQMNANVFIKKDYENISDWALGQNKPNSNPIKPNQTQFPKSPNECKLTYNKGLQKKRRFHSPNKQTQNKPNY